jgi:hypothetical protein
MAQPSTVRIRLSPPARSRVEPRPAPESSRPRRRDLRCFRAGARAPRTDVGADLEMFSFTAARGCHAGRMSRGWKDRDRRTRHVVAPSAPRSSITDQLRRCNASPRCGRSSMVERQPSKLHTRVRFPSPAPTLARLDLQLPWNAPRPAVAALEPCCCSSVVEHFLGKEEVLGSSPSSSSTSPFFSSQSQLDQLGSSAVRRGAGRPVRGFARTHTGGARAPRSKPTKQGAGPTQQHTHSHG